MRRHCHKLSGDKTKLMKKYNLQENILQIKKLGFYLFKKKVHILSN